MNHVITVYDSEGIACVVVEDEDHRHLKTYTATNVVVIQAPGGEKYRTMLFEHHGRLVTADMQNMETVCRSWTIHLVNTFYTLEEYVFFTKELAQARFKHKLQVFADLLAAD